MTQKSIAKIRQPSAGTLAGKRKEQDQWLGFLNSINFICISFPL